MRSKSSSGRSDTPLFQGVREAPPFFWFRGQEHLTRSMSVKQKADSEILQGGISGAANKPGRLQNEDYVRVDTGGKKDTLASNLEHSWLSPHSQNADMAVDAWNRKR